MKIIINLLVRSLSVFIAAWLIPGVVVDSFMAALVTAVVLGILNALIRPVLLFLTLPVNILSLGLFTLVINAFLVMLASLFVNGFNVDSFLTGLVFSIILSLVNWFLNSLIKD